MTDSANVEHGWMWLATTDPINQLLRDLNIVVLVTDQRRIEVIANGLPFWQAVGH